MPNMYDLSRHQMATSEKAYRLVAQAQAQGRSMTPEEQHDFDQLMMENDRLTLELQRDSLEKMPLPTAVERLLPAGVKAFEELSPQQQQVMRHEWAKPLPDVRPPLPGAASRWPGRAQERGRWGAQQSYATLFGPPRPSGFQPGEWLSAISIGLHDPRLQMASAAMSEGDGSRGGVYVPQELQAMVLDPVLHESDFLSRALVVPMTSLTKTIPSFDGVDQQPTANLYGFTFQWLAELQQVTPGTGQTRAITLHANLAGIYVEMSNELWADSGTEFQRDFTDRVSAALKTNIESAMVTGLGTGMPLGILNAGSLLTVTPVAAQPANTIVYDNITAMFAAAANPTLATWVVNPRALPQLMRTTVKESPTDTAASHVPLVMQGADGALSMLGRPLVVSSLLPGPGNIGDLLFVDWQAYVVGLRQQWVLEFSQAPGWYRNAQSARILVRLDGQPRLNQLMVGADGQTYSPFVAIGARLT